MPKPECLLVIRPPSAKSSSYPIRKYFTCLLTLISSKSKRPSASSTVWGPVSEPQRIPKHRGSRYYWPLCSQRPPIQPSSPLGEELYNTGNMVGLEPVSLLSYIIEGPPRLRTK